MTVTTLRKQNKTKHYTFKNIPSMLNQPFCITTKIDEDEVNGFPEGMSIFIWQIIFLQGGWFQKKKKKAHRNQPRYQYKASKTRRCTGDKGSDEGKRTKCSSSMTRRTHYIFSRKGSNLKTMALYVLFSVHVSCVPFLDGISQWHLFPVGPWIHAAIGSADTTLQYQVDSLLLS